MTGSGDALVGGGVGAAASGTGVEDVAAAGVGAEVLLVAAASCIINNNYIPL